MGKLFSKIKSNNKVSYDVAAAEQNAEDDEEEVATARGVLRKNKQATSQAVDKVMAERQRDIETSESNSIQHEVTESTERPRSRTVQRQENIPDHEEPP